MKCRAYLIVFISVGMIVAGSAGAQEKVAVLDFQSIVAPQDYGVAVAEILRTELVGLGDYTIIERGMLQQIIEEQSLQLSGAIDSETAVEIGKLTGAQLVVTGSIVKTGSVYTINARFVDVETGIAKVGQNIRGQGEDEISNMVHQLALIITGNTIASEDVIAKTAEPESQATPAASADGSQVSQSGDVLLFSFENPREFEQWEAESGRVGSRMEVSTEYATEGTSSLYLALQPSRDWQGIRTAHLPADWSEHLILAFDMYYEADSQEAAFPLLVRIDDERTNRLQRDWFIKPYMLKPGWDTIRLYVEDIGTQIDIRHVKQLILSTNKLQQAANIYLDHFRFEQRLPPAPTEPFQISFETPGEALVNFQPKGLMIRMQPVKEHATHGQTALQLNLPRKLPKHHYPGIESLTFPRDWSNYQTLACDIFLEYQGKSDLTAVIRMDDAASTSYETRFHHEMVLKPGENHVVIATEDIRQVLDITKIVKLHIFLDDPSSRSTLYIDNIVLE